jgi:hypothetical protein
MSRVTALATRKAVSSGALLAAGGGLILYQLTSLVLGPAASRELHISLTIPAVSAYEPTGPLSSGASLVIGTRAVPPPSLVPPRRTVPHRAAATRVALPASAPLLIAVAKTPPSVPVAPVASPPPIAPKPHDDD